ncbi:MAG TPA: hypothetical protein DDX54_03075 [Rhodospirillaceae bacterium]|jgi:hypothetical protein|nr:hypothetical protein [Alphaproteobacteria bacterium]HBH26366.1 hypothetical protein [Rhodospirillaceae bacterium]
MNALLQTFSARAGAILVLALALILLPEIAEARSIVEKILGLELFEDSGCKYSDDGSLGWAMCNIVQSLNTVPGVIAVIAYIAGLVFGVRAIFKLKKHVEKPDDVPMEEPIKWGLACGALLSLPFIINVVTVTLVGPQGATNPLEYSEFLGSASSGGLDAVLVNFMTDIWGPAHTLIGAFAYLAALVLTLIALMRIIKDAQEGTKGPMGLGTITTLAIAGLLFSLDDILGIFAQSVFDDNVVTTAPLILYLAGADYSTIMHVTAVASAAIAFFWLIGLVAFIRGWFIIRDVAEGDQQASFMAGATHIIGGALCVNLGPLLNAVQITTGVWLDGVIFT